jgi:hypothetical protein
MTWNVRDACATEIKTGYSGAKGTLKNRRERPQCRVRSAAVRKYSEHRSTTVQRAAGFSTCPQGTMGGRAWHGLLIAVKSAFEKMGKDAFASEESS